MLNVSAVTFHTGGSYGDMARRLVASGERHGVRVEAREVRNRGVWWKNVAQKPGLLRLALAETADDALLYTDADCQFVAGPDVAALARGLADNDVLVRHRVGGKEPYNCGVMLLAKRPFVLAFLNLWADLSERYADRHDTGDQALLAEAFTRSGLSVGVLPVEYNVLPGDGTVPAATIVHRKASREDPALSSWKSARLLEQAMVQRLKAIVHGYRTEALVITDRPLKSDPADDVTVWNVGHLAQTGPIAELVWVETPVNVVTREGPHWARGSTFVVPANGPDGNLATYLRNQVSPKPHVGDVPERIAAYYPSAAVRMSFSRQELCGTMPWTAAVNAAGIRGYKRVHVIGPDWVYNPVRDVASAFSSAINSLTFA